MSGPSTDQRFVAAARVTSKSPRKKASNKDRHKEHVAASQWIAGGFVIAATLLAGMFPTESSNLKLLIASVVLLPAAAIVVARSKVFGNTTPAIIGFATIASLFISWGFFQTVELPQSLYHLVASGSVESRASFVDPSLDAISTSLATLGEPDVVIPNKHSISMIPEQGSRTLAKYFVAVATFLLAATIFRTRRLRKSVLWTLVFSSVLMAFWGLVQRGTGTSNLFPFVSNPVNTAPFGFYIYKNAGAAAILPGIAAIASLLLAIAPRSLRRKPSVRHADASQNSIMPRNRMLGNDGANHELPHAFKTKKQATPPSISIRASLKWATSPRAMVLLAMFAFLICGVLASLSRGATVAIGIALVTVALLPPVNRFMHRFAFVAALIVVGCGVVAGLTNLSSIVDRRSNQWQTEAVLSDVRWQHWETCMATIQNYFPSGTGLGSYGYASLPQQTSPSRLWFREAHNQYLEVIAELGLPGLLMVIAFMLMATRWCVTLLRDRESREMNSLGVAGLILLIATAIQSAFDFVVVIPGILLLNALFFGVIAAAAQRSKIQGLNAKFASHQQVPEAVHSGHGPFRLIAARLTPRWIAIAASIILTFSTWQLYQENKTDTVLESTQIASIPTTPPTDSEITTNLKKLDEVVDSGRANSAIFRRRAMWNLAAYRMELVKAAKEEGLTVPWEATAPEQLFRILQGLSLENRESVAADFVASTRLKSLLRATLHDLALSIAANPFVPQSHLCCAYLSPIAAMPWELWSTNSRQLSQSSPDLLFANGLMGYFAGDTDMMIDQWRRSLSVSNNNLKSIIELSQSVLSAEQFAEELFPEHRSDLLVTTIRFKGRPFSPLIDLKVTPELVNAAVSCIHEDDHLSEFERDSMKAQIYVANQQWKEAASHWHNAVHQDGRAVESRYQLASVLRQLGRPSEALQHCETGLLLSPYDSRFRELSRQLKRTLNKLNVHALPSDGELSR